MRAVGERLRTLRQSAKLSQAEMAKILRIDQSNLPRYEAGKTSPSFETMIKYADYFDVSMDYIFARSDKPQGKLYEYRPNLTADNPQLKQFIEMCFDPNSSINERLKQTLIDMLGETKK